MKMNPAWREVELSVDEVKQILGLGYDRFQQMMSKQPGFRGWTPVVEGVAKRTLEKAVNGKIKVGDIQDYWGGVYDDYYPAGGYLICDLLEEMWEVVKKRAKEIFEGKSE